MARSVDVEKRSEFVTVGGLGCAWRVSSAKSRQWHGEARRTIKKLCSYEKKGIRME